MAEAGISEPFDLHEEGGTLILRLSGRWTLDTVRRTDRVVRSRRRACMRSSSAEICLDAAPAASTWFSMESKTHCVPHRNTLLTYPNISQYAARLTHMQRDTFHFF